MKLLPLTALAGLAASPALAADMAISVEVPRLSVAEYHNPYIAFWLETPERAHVQDLAVWYDTEMRDDEGETWLKDMRQWWRRSGRALDLPVDGLSRPTRAPGTHEMNFSAADFTDLPTGEYRLIVEVVREVGGREMLEIPFQWPPSESQTLTARGEEELGELTLSLSPSSE